MSISVRNPAFACFAAAALSLGLARPALAGPAADLPSGLHPIEQLAPRQGAVLQGGTTADLSWAELPAFASLRGVEEWEAFLSLDGGKSYPVRITPHLDRDLKVLRWQVPPVSSSDARLLFRFGREETGEVGYAPQVSFEIERAATGTPIHLPDLAPQRGESALPGQPGVVSWVTGSRRGTGLRQVEARRPLELNPSPALAGGSSGEPLPYAPEERRTEVRAALATSGTLASWHQQGEPRTFELPLTPPIPPLLQTQRQNE